MTEVHVVLPEGIDDPRRPSGGNTYDRRVCDGLATSGWTVQEHHMAGAWPQPDASARTALADALDQMADGAIVLMDGLIASAVPDVLTPRADRLRLVALVHMPLGHRPDAGATESVRAREAEALACLRAIVATSDWTRSRLIELYALPIARIHVARPGVDIGGISIGTDGGGALLCVAAVTRDKGHDVMVDALAMLTDLPWRCTCVGSTERDAAFAALLRDRSEELGIDDRLTFTGALTGAALEQAYTAADVLVLPSRAETYGMVVTEAFAHGLPVIATDAGGIPEALGDGGAGVLVPPGDPVALGAAIKAWLSDASVRARLRRAAADRRRSLTPWSITTAELAAVLAGVAD